MIEIFGYKFVETWSELSPRYAEYDKIIELSLAPFPKYAQRQSLGIGPVDRPIDTNPIEVQNLMVSGSVIMQYATDLEGRLMGLTTDREVKLARAMAQHNATLDAKSEAARTRQLSVIPEIQSLTWEVADLKNMYSYVKGIHKVLEYATQNWRSIFYGTQVDKKSQPPIEAPIIGDGGAPGTTHG